MQRGIRSFKLRKLWPLAGADSQHKQWLAGQRSDIAYYRGDYKHAIELAREVDRPFYKRSGRTVGDRCRSASAARTPRSTCGAVHSATS